MKKIILFIRRIAGRWLSRRLGYVSPEKYNRLNSRYKAMFQLAAERKRTIEEFARLLGLSTQINELQSELIDTGAEQFAAAVEALERAIIKKDSSFCDFCQMDFEECTMECHYGSCFLFDPNWNGAGYET